MCDRFRDWDVSGPIISIRVFSPGMFNGANQNAQRPEALESMFILWRITKDPKYREHAWAIFQAFNRYARVESGGAIVFHFSDCERASDFRFSCCLPMLPIAVPRWWFSPRSGLLVWCHYTRAAECSNYTGALDLASHTVARREICRCIERSITEVDLYGSMRLFSCMPDAYPRQLWCRTRAGARPTLGLVLECGAEFIAECQRVHPLPID